MLETDPLGALAVASARAATPLALAALGELVTERAGVLNLGVEGMMQIGAVAAFGATLATGAPGLGLVAGLAGGMAMAGLFALLTLGLRANQVATGFALTLFGIGLSAFLGQDLVGTPIQPIGPLFPPALAGLPLVGPVLFGHDPLVYLTIAAVAAVAWLLEHSRPGLILRAVGDNHTAAHALGTPVLAVRTGAVLFGGALAGLAGAYLSLVYTPMWVEEMTAGRGWIAVGLVVFAAWRPWRLLLGAYLFGGVSIAQFHAQALGWQIPSPVLAMLPYLATILVLVVISASSARLRLNAPACLGKVFTPER